MKTIYLLDESIFTTNNIIMFGEKTIAFKDTKGDNVVLFTRHISHIE